MNTHQPDATVVIVSWNTKELLLKCIDSIRAQEGGLSVEVVVVDNASRDGTELAVRRTYEDVVLVENALNCGFAAANNQGFALAKGRYVLILNPDTLLDRQALLRMVDVLEREPAVGMVGPRLCSPDGSTQEPCARLFPNLADVLFDEVLGLTKRGRLRRAMARQGYAFDRSQDVEAISGAAMMVRTNELLALGGFSESFLHYGEDLDLCSRVWKSGRRIWYRHDAVVIHYGGQSSKQAQEWVTINAILSYAEYFHRCVGKGSAIAFRAMVWLLWAPLHLGKGFFKLLIGREDPERFMQRARAVRDVLLSRRATWSHSRGE